MESEDSPERQKEMGILVSQEFIKDSHIVLKSSSQYYDWDYSTQ